MSRVFITGDCHGEYGRFGIENFPQQEFLTRDDYVIVTGDFGYWNRSSEQEQWRNWLAQKSFTILFVDGNHENFDMLSELPTEEWRGGKIHKIADNIFHLMRGQIFDIAEKKFFTMGGAASHDIQDGILDPNAPDFLDEYRWMALSGAMFRVLRKSWWPEEMPSESDFEEAEINLLKFGNSVDYIVSHDCPDSVLDLLGGGMYTQNELTHWFEERIENKVRFSGWFFGHHHENRALGKHICLYKDIVDLETLEKHLAKYFTNR